MILSGLRSISEILTVLWTTITPIIFTDDKESGLFVAHKYKGDDSGVKKVKVCANSLPLIIKAHILDFIALPRMGSGANRFRHQCNRVLHCQLTLYLICQFQIRCQKNEQMGIQLSDGGRNIVDCSLRAISSFPTMFYKAICCLMRQNKYLWSKGLY